MKRANQWGCWVACVVGAMMILGTPAVGQEKGALAATVQGGEADRAWEEIQAAKRAYSNLVEGLEQGSSAKAGTPADLQGAMAQVKALTGAIGDKAGAFVERFPNDERASEAREVAMKMWRYLAIGDAARSAKYAKLLDACLADLSLPEDERAELYFRKLQLENRGFGAQTQLDNVRALGKRFPTSRVYYYQLLGIARAAQGGEGKEIAAEVAGASAAPGDLRRVAQDMVDGKPPYVIGHPVEFRFTAVDGREIDVAKMKGTVVLVDFWATWCGPCVKEMPALKALYEKYHDKGLEVIGISYDSVQPQLLRFIKEKGIPWPQYFEPWANTLSIRYPVNGIPTVWLIGRDGNLAFTSVGEGLEEKVVGLLRAGSQGGGR